MCGRMQRLGVPWSEIYGYLNVVLGEGEQPPALGSDDDPDVCPTTRQRVVVQGEHGREVRMMRWGLIPSWHRGAVRDWKSTTHNARAETVATAPTFRDSFAGRRCLVPTSGWFEWNGPKGSRKKWWISPRSGEPIMLAGIWDRCRTADQGEIESFATLTKPALHPLADIHDRAPVVVWRDDQDRWLNPQQDCLDILGRDDADMFDAVCVP